MTDLERAPILRVMPGPADINANGHIFGGWVLSQMDIAAGIVASRRAKGSVATVAIEAMEFIAPIHLRDLISVYANVERVGRTSMAAAICSLSATTSPMRKPWRSSCRWAPRHPPPGWSSETGGCCGE
jgi:acyl-CoA thioesterase YciA